MTVTPLPRALAPLPEETIAGFLLRTSAYLDVTPAQLAQRLGLESASTASSSIDLGYAITLPEHARANLAVGLRLQPAEIAAMTLDRWDGLFSASGDTSSETVAPTRRWIHGRTTRYCPQCLADIGDDRLSTRWNVAWRSPWSFACLVHRRLLLATCPTCDVHVGESGPGRVQSLIPQPGLRVTDVAECRAPGPTREGICGQRLDHAAHGREAADSELAAQAQLDALLTFPSTRTTDQQRLTLGVRVDPGQWLTDLRAVGTLLVVAAPSTLPDGLDDAHVDALTEAHARLALLPSRPADDDRLLTRPPKSVETLAAMLTSALHIITTTEPGKAGEVLDPMVSSALLERRTFWLNARSVLAPSDALKRHFSPKISGELSAHVLRSVPGDLPLPTSSDHLPAHLPQHLYQEHLARFDTISEGNQRRAAMLAIAMLIDDIGLPAASERLGIPIVPAQAAISRVSKVLIRGGDGDDYRGALRLIASDLAVAPPIDYGHRRAWFKPDWIIPDEDWRTLQDRLLSDRLARVDTPWTQRRPIYSAWAWARATGGDIALAPVLKTRNDRGRMTTGGDVQTSTALINRQPQIRDVIWQYTDAHLVPQIEAVRCG